MTETAMLQHGLQRLTITVLVAAWQTLVHAHQYDPSLGMRPLKASTLLVDGVTVDSKQFIPPIIHQSYLPNEATLEKLSTAPRSHFRRDWRRSCQIHNPGYEYMFWDETKANAFIAEHYPHMVPYYNRAPSNVLKSDVLRVMILDTMGGVWLDIDTECFSPMDPILRGFHLVAQAEWTYQLCNSHVAGVPGHPIWKQLMDWFIKKVEANVKDPLKHTGPVALTTLVKAHIQPANPDRNMSKIAGAWTDPAYPDSQFRAYGLQDAWFLPCRWAKSYMSPCQSQLARSKAIVRQLTNGVTVALALADEPDTPQDIKDLVDAAKTFAKIRGSHEYSNSWTTWKFSDGLKTMVRAQEALVGLRPFFKTPGLFEEYSGWVEGGCGDRPEDLEGLGRFQICGSVLRAAAEQGACTVVSIRGRRDEQIGTDMPLNLDLEHYVADRYNCMVQVHTLVPRHSSDVEGNVVVKGEPLQLGPVYDQYSHPPTLTLTRFLDMVLKPQENITLLHIDCAADCRLWDVLNELQLTGSLVLRRAGSLLVDLGGLPSRRRHMLNTVYQHLYQEVGMVGYSWGRSLTKPPSRINPLLYAGGGHGIADMDGIAGAVVRKLQDAGSLFLNGTKSHSDGISAGSRQEATGSVNSLGRQGGNALQRRALQGKQAQLEKHSEIWEGPFKLPRLRLGFARVL